MTTKYFRESLEAARRVGTPIICIRTTDPASAMNQYEATFSSPEKLAARPIMRFDYLSGVTGRNPKGAAEAKRNFDKTQNVEDVLIKAQNMVEKSILYFLNPQRIWEQPPVSQGIWNLRDSFKATHRVLVLITTIGATLPPEIVNDVLIFDEPLP